MTRVVFILSTRHAGSTWLGLILGSHSLCEADGRAQCVVLHGVERVAVADAFAFAAERIPGRVLIDVSKRWNWCEQFLNRPELDVRTVHLVRHPAGVLERKSRRRPGVKYEELLEEWAQYALGGPAPRRRRAAGRHVAIRGGDGGAVGRPWTVPTRS